MPSQTQPAQTPRQEARPLTWEELTQEQKRAISDASALFRAMAKEEDRIATISSAFQFLPVIDLNRSSRVVLIDGERGSGKTAAMITLLDAYQKIVRGVVLDDELSARILPTDNVVPIGLLDLKPTPMDPNVLLMLMSPFERLVRFLEGEQTPKRVVHGMLGNDNCAESPIRTSWERLRHTLVAAWSSNSAERRAKLDAASFVREEIDREAAQRGLREIFRDFVAVASREYAGKMRTNAMPLFLIAIDDVDMNPEYCTRVLDLMRAFWHPRVAFVVTGDTELFVRTIEKELHSNLGLPGADVQQIQQNAFRFSVGVEPELRRLAEDVFQKDIPRAHRLGLRGLSPSERLVSAHEMIEVLGRSKVSTRAPPLSSSEVQSLTRYLEIDRRPAPANLLPGRIRQLVDEGQLLKQGLGSAAEPPAEAVIAELWKAFVRRTGLGEEAESGLLRLVELDSKGRLIVDASEMTIEAARFREIRLERGEGIPDLVAVIPDELVIRLPGRTLSPEQTGAFSAVVDVAADSENAWLRGGDTLGSRMEMALAVSEQFVSDAEGAIRCPWPVPNWVSFVDYDLLRIAWERSLEKPRGLRDRHADVMPKIFLKLILEVAESRKPVPVRVSSRAELPNWSQLAARVVRLALPRRVQNLRDRANSEWAKTVAGLYAAPEITLNERSSAEFLSGLTAGFGSEWEAVVESLLRNREKWYSAPRRKRSARTIQDVDARWPKHPWTAISRQISTDPESQNKARDIQQLMQSFELDYSIRELGRNETLQRYFTSERVDVLARSRVSNLESAEKIIRQFLSTRGASRQVLVALWRHFASAVDRPERLDWLEVARSGELRLQPPFSSIPMHVLANVWDVVHGQGVWLDEPGRLQAREWPDMMSTAGEVQLSGPEAAVLRAAWDFSVEERGAVIDDFPIVGWPGVSRVIAGRTVYPWPCPRWVQLVFWEASQQGWSRVLAGTRATLATGGLETVVDGLALHVMQTMTDWPIAMRGMRDLELRPAAALEAFLEAVRARKGVSGSSFERFFQTWIEYLVVFAAPEAGLTYAAAKQIISKFGVGNSEDVQGMRAAFMRRQFKEISEEGVARILSDLDSEDPKHPWVEAFGPHGRPRSRRAK